MSSLVQDWLKDYDIIDESANDLMHKLNQRNQYATNTQPFAKSDLHIKELFRKFQQQTRQLQERLTQLSQSNQITKRESERRQNLVDNLNNRSKEIEYLIGNPDANKRSALLSQSSYHNYNSSANETVTVGWNDFDNEDNPGPSSYQNDQQSVTQLRENKQKLIEEQDKGLDTLSTIVTRQKHLAQGINSEIDLHNEIIEDISEAFEDTDTRLLRNTRNIRVVGTKSSTCGYWMVILLLLIAIIVVSVIPT